MLVKVGRAYIEARSKFTGRIFARFGAKRAYVRGVETPVTPDNPDEVDAGDVVEGVGVGGQASASSSASGWVVVSS